MSQLQNKNFWEEAWLKHIENYLKTIPRTGFFIKTLLRNKISSTLEIACGSSRDSIYLANEGYKSTASDFDDKTIAYLQHRFGHLENLNYQIADAFNLPFDDNSFDLVYHNGFFIYFHNNQDVFDLLKEQERVTRKYILILVHNRLNSKLVSEFKKLSNEDKLYDIRFFDPIELEELIFNLSLKIKKVIILKFGSFGRFGVDSYLSKIFKLPFINSFIETILLNLIFKLYQTQMWEDTERIACLIELDK
ncbi:class I SAM-dependent methyltransferase [Anabaena lutea]|uniref:Class I SAM-dependent methyltransferase n=1 Tax=Anabaena lutea FACHB-196 TaxID=2692881 RepID=A0ABR8FHZ0_9NOST|nr:class I SAM-dependent methyltransferase [Anabaena lutea]MBD2569391.1 class I SAM-dependent methyltransferase [Anabaena lutea FACHB-196]